MSHSDKRSISKVVRQCDLPLATTAVVVDMLITELAVFRFVDRRMKLVKPMSGVSESQFTAATEAEYDTDLAWRLALRADPRFDKDLIATPTMTSAQHAGFGGARWSRYSISCPLMLRSVRLNPA